MNDFHSILLFAKAHSSYGHIICICFFVKKITIQKKRNGCMNECTFESIVYFPLYRDSNVSAKVVEKNNIALFKLVLNSSSVLLWIPLAQFVFLLRHTYKTFCFDLNNVSSKSDEVSFEILTFLIIL